MKGSLDDGRDRGINSCRKVRARLKILLKNDSRRLILTTVIAFVSLLLLTSFLITWNSTKQVNFLAFVEDREDEEISAYYSTIKDGYIPNYNLRYLEDLTVEMTEKMASVYPNVISQKIASMMSVEFYTSEISSTDFSHSELRTTTAENLPVLNQSLISGRMPENNNEVIYLQEQNESTYALNDEISFQTVRIPNSFAQNFTIVGILGPLEYQFEKNGYSSSLVHWQEHIHEYRYVYTIQDIFYTIEENFFPTINSYSEIDTGRAVVVDFIYNYTKLEAQKIPHYLSQHQALLQANIQFPSESVEKFTMCKDIYNALVEFNYFWIFETIKSFLLLTPVFILFFFVTNELSSGEQVKLRNIIYKMKLQGLSNNAIRILFLIKSLLIFSLAIFFGIIVGLLVVLAMVGIMSLAITFQLVLKFLLDPLFLTLLLLTVFAQSTNMLLSENFLLRKTSVEITKLTPQEDMKKKKRVWLTINERICLLTGIGILLPGGILALVFPAESLANTSVFISLTNVLSLIAWGFIIIGSLVVIIGIFNIVARLIVAQLVEIGNKEWAKEKKRISYILKNIVTNRENYKRVIIIALIVNIGVLPGVVLTPSINKQIALESNLRTGCADLLIENLDNITSFQQKIEAITGVQQTTIVSTIYVYYVHNTFAGATTIYSVGIVSIHNCEEFNQVINWKSLGRVRYSKDDITALSKNLTYLMDEQFAKKNDFNKPDVILHNTFYGEKTEWLDLEYINSFEYFPLLPFAITESYSFNEIGLSFSLITSQQTINLLEEASNKSSASTTDYMLVKTTADYNLTAIANEIQDLYPWVSIVTPTSEESELSYITNTFTSVFSIISSVIFLFIVFLYGYMIAGIIYLQRLRIVETEYRLGINKKQIWQGMLLEVVLTTAIPVIISTLFSILYLLLLKQLIPVQQIYREFTLWLPWWVIILTTLMSECLIVGGNATSLIPLIQNYQPVKVE